MSDQISSIDQTLSKVRMLVNELIKEEVGAEDISYVLAYVATEFGLHVTNFTAGVMPVVLAAVSQAVVDLGKTVKQVDASSDFIEIPQQSVMFH